MAASYPAHTGTDRPSRGDRGPGASGASRVAGIGFDRGDGGGAVPALARRIRWPATWRSRALGFLQRAIELLRVTGRLEPGPHGLLTDQAGDPAQRLDVRARSRLRPDEHEEEPDRLSVERIEIHRLASQPGGHAQFRDRGGLAVRDRHTVPDPRGEHGL